MGTTNETTKEHQDMKCTMFTIVLNMQIKGRVHFQGVQYHQLVPGKYHRRIGQLTQNSPAKGNTNLGFNAT